MSIDIHKVVPNILVVYASEVQACHVNGESVASIRDIDWLRDRIVSVRENSTRRGDRWQVDWRLSGSA
jgi:hypothetical protein